MPGERPPNALSPRRGSRWRPRQRRRAQLHASRAPLGPLLPPSSRASVPPLPLVGTPRPSPDPSLRRPIACFRRSVPPPRRGPLFCCSPSLARALDGSRSRFLSRSPPALALPFAPSLPYRPLARSARSLLPSPRSRWSLSAPPPIPRQLYPSLLLGFSAPGPCAGALAQGREQRASAGRVALARAPRTHADGAPERAPSLRGARGAGAPRRALGSCAGWLGGPASTTGAAAGAHVRRGVSAASDRRCEVGRDVGGLRKREPALHQTSPSLTLGVAALGAARECRSAPLQEAAPLSRAEVLECT